MHIADGILPAEFCVAAYGVSLGGVYLLGRKTSPEEASRMGLLAAATFVASLVHFPFAGSSVHLGLFGLLGALLGRRSFPVVFVALLFQALLLQHGGLLALGVNTLNMGAGALLGWAVWSWKSLPEEARGFAAGFVGSMVPALLMATEFSFAGYGRGFYAIALIYLAVALVEGAVTTSMIAMFRRLKPEVLQRAAA